MNAGDMKKKPNRRRTDPDRDTMRAEYDFSHAKRGVTAARYAQGANIAVIDADLLDVFPNGETVNKTLRALAPVIREQRRAVKRKSA